MSGFLDNFLAWYFGLSTQGESGDVLRQWRLESAWNWQNGFTVVFLLGLLAVTILLWRRITLHRPSRLRFFLLMTRLLILLVSTLLILQVQLRTVAFGKPQLVFLIDTSASMSFSDSYSEDDQKKLETAGFETDSTSRFRILQQTIAESNNEDIRFLRSNFRLDVYTFDSKLNSRLWSSSTEEREDSTSADDSLTLKDRISTLRPNGDTTEFRASLEELGKRIRDISPLAVIIFSDGQATNDLLPGLSRTLKNFERLRIPIMTVGFGSRNNQSDLVLKDAKVSPVGFAGDEQPAQVILTSNTTIDIPVNLTVRSTRSNEEVLSTTIDSLIAGQPHTVSLNLPALAPGYNSFELLASPVSGETNIKNNSQRVRVWGRESNLKVLLIDQTPRWEFRHLKSSLERDKRLSVETFLMDSDPDYAVEDRTALARMPEDFSGYDAVILGDIDFSNVTNRFTQNLDQFIRMGSGGLLFLSGNSSLSTIEAKPLIADLHPATPQNIESEKRLAVIAEITPEGRAQSLFPAEFFADQQTALPELFPIYRELSLKPASLVLMEGAPQIGNTERFPLILTMRYGNGVIIQHIVDDTWRWRVLQEGRPYRGFWSQMIRNACRRKMITELPTVELFTNQDRFTLNEPAEIILVNRSDQFSEAEQLPVLLRRDDEPATTIQLQRTEQASNTFNSTLTDLLPGKYLVSAPSLTAPQTSLNTTFEVVNLDPERTYKPMNEELLQKMSQATRGKFFTPSEFDQLVQALPSGQLAGSVQTRIISIWNRWEVFLLLTFLLATEWATRRISGVD